MIRRLAPLLLSSAILGALGLAACTVGPNYHPPQAIPHADGGFGRRSATARNTT